MRCFCLLSLLVVSGCNARETQPADRNAADQSVQRAGSASADPVRNELPAAQPEPKAAGHPCRVQDGKTVTRKLKALGTEPFWAAEIDGRCATYKTPEDQPGTRIWTHIDTSEQQTVWKGAFNGQEFQLTVKPAGPQGCSDGMSDKAYPLQATISVEGEIRSGCAEPD